MWATMRVASSLRQSGEAAPSLLLHAIISQVYYCQAVWQLTDSITFWLIQAAAICSGPV